MDKIKIRLEPNELLQAALVGTIRNAENLSAGLRDAHGASRDNGWNLHIEGACGEAAFAKYKNLFWSVGKLRGNDVDIFQVRTATLHTHDLIIHPKDDDNAKFVLITGLAPEYLIRGWILGKDAKKPEWWGDPGGNNRAAYFLPYHALNYMKDL